MGLNIGFRVKQQLEGYMREGSNPRGTLEEIGQQVRAFIEERVPGGGYTVHDPTLHDGWYGFDIRPSHYGSELKDGDTSPLYEALLIWIFHHFGTNDLEITGYHTP
jgi:hypothetical protein